jgi:hypothetical protein
LVFVSRNEASIIITIVSQFWSKDDVVADFYIETGGYAEQVSSRQIVTPPLNSRSNTNVIAK